MSDGSIKQCTVIRTDDMDPETAVVRYRKRADGWHVQTPADAEFRPFATESASEQTVVELINKKWDARYADPDAFGADTDGEADQLEVGAFDAE